MKKVVAAGATGRLERSVVQASKPRHCAAWPSTRAHRLLCTVLSFCAISSAGAADTPYVIRQLTDNGYGDAAPQINDSGQIAWHGFDGDGDPEVFFYDGSFITKLTDNDHSDAYPHLNNNGYVVWYQHRFPHNEIGQEIVLYDGTTITELTDGTYSHFNPRINDENVVVWHGYDGEDTEIFLYDGSAITQLTDNDYSDGSPQINESGHVFWSGMGLWTIDYVLYPEVFFFDGSTIEQLTDNDEKEDKLAIHDSGHAVWESSSNVFYFDGVSIVQLTDDEYEYVGRLGISDEGHVIWGGAFPGTDDEIFLYQDGTITPLTNNEITDLRPNINARGQAVWEGAIPNQDSTFWRNDIFVYDGSSIWRLTNDIETDTVPQINNRGEVVWQGWDGTDFEIYLASPAGPRIVPEFTKIPWWKSEDYWGLFDPRIALSSPRGVDVPGFEPEPIPCPECMFTREAQTANMPPQLPQLYDSANDVLGKAGSPGFHESAQQRLMAQIGGIPEGQRFDKAAKASAIKAIDGLRGENNDSRSQFSELFQAINSIELDWRVPRYSAQKVTQGSNRAVDFGGVAEIAFDQVKTSGEVSLVVDGHLPALVSGAEPLWPVASYRFESTEKLEGRVEISIYFGGFAPLRDDDSLHILEWDGRSYKDVTAVVDRPAKTIRGRTNRLGTYVITRFSSNSRDHK